MSNTPKELVPTIRIVFDQPPSPTKYSMFCWEDCQPEDDIRSEFKKARPGARILEIHRNEMNERRLVE